MNIELNPTTDATGNDDAPPPETAARIVHDLEKTLSTIRQLASATKLIAEGITENG